MKKFKVICAAIFSFLFCLSSSIYFKHQFNIEGDYLSSFSTLIAAIVAYQLFNDWKVEHKFKLLEKFHDTLKERALRLNSIFDAMNLEFRYIEGSMVVEGNKHLENALGILSQFNKETQSVLYLLREYKCCLDTLRKDEFLINNENKLKHHVENFNQITDFYMDLTLKRLVDINVNTVNTTTLNSWKKILIEFEHYCSVDLADFYFKHLNLNN
ncbi:TPA: hypothetical protein ACNICD_003119 [Acinetobacter baumannii]